MATKTAEEIELARIDVMTRCVRLWKAALEAGDARQAAMFQEAARALTGHDKP